MYVNDLLDSCKNAARLWYAGSMAVAELALDWCAVADPRPLKEIAAEFGVSPRTMWTYVKLYGLTQYLQPGKGKLVHLDPVEVRRKVRARPKRTATDPPE